jgi:hypothetical protein
MMQDDRTAFEIRFELIKAMPDGPERDQAMEQLFMDYPGLAADAQDRIDKGFEMATQQTDPGMLAGPASNPFTQYVGASPLTHIAQGAEKYMGHKQMKQGREQNAQISANKQAASMGLGQAALQQGQAAGLRSMPGARGEVGPDGLTEEERRQRQMMMMRSYT